MIMHGIIVICVNIIGFILTLITTALGGTLPLTQFAEALQWLTPYINKAIRYLQFFYPSTLWVSLVNFTLEITTLYITISLVTAVVRLWRGGN